LNELETQAESIDRIENHVENIHANLDTSDRLLRGIESLPAYIGNALRSKQKPKPPPTATDRSINIKKQEKHMDIEILYKKKNDCFVPALLRLSDNDFSVLNPEDEQLLFRGLVWKYDEIVCIAMRARHEHLDVRFKEKR